MGQRLVGEEGGKIMGDQGSAYRCFWQMTSHALATIVESLKTRGEVLCLEGLSDTDHESENAFGDMFV